MHEIIVVTLGPGARQHLTLGAVEALRSAKTIVLRTVHHGAAEWLTEQNLPFTTLDVLYEQSEDFDSLTASATDHLLALARKGKVCFGVADPGSDEVVRRLRSLEEAKLRVVPGVMLASPFLAAQDTPQPLLVCDAMRLNVYDAQRPLCLTEINSRALAGDCKLKLLEHYDADAPLYFFPPGEGGTRRCVHTTLEELDRQPRYNHTAGALLLPGTPFQKTRYDVQDLVLLMRRLRAPDGCPWDREQTHQSLSRYLVEEANEAAHAIYQQDWAAVADELGDVLLQVIFHATVGEQTGTMTLGDITTAICTKLINRHRHIFGGDRAQTAQDVSANWDKIKEEERGRQTVSQKMHSLPHSLPPLLRALKVQEAARKVGFDWPDARGALLKVHEEADEVLQEVKKGGSPAMEMGDLLFAGVNAARLLGVNPDEVVSLATEKFINRFEIMEKTLICEQKAMKSLTLQEWDVYWERSKQAE